MKTSALVLLLIAIYCSCFGQLNRVGIGTLTPAGKLQINHKTVPGSPTLYLLDSTGGGGPTLQFTKQGSANVFSITGNTTGTDENKGLILSWIGDSLLWLKPNGALGLGTNNPQARMQINHKTTFPSPTLLVVDSTGGIGSLISMGKDGKKSRFHLLAKPGDDPSSTFIHLMGDDPYIGGLPDAIRGVYIRGDGRMGLGVADMQGKLQINHRSTNNSPAMLILDSSQGVGTAIDFRKQGVSKGFRMISKPAVSDQEARFGILYAEAQDGSGLDNANFILTGGNRIGFGANNPTGRVQINHSSGSTNAALVLFDSTNGNGAGVLFQKQGVNNLFAIYSDGTDVYFNPKEITIDKPVPWQFKGNGRLGFGTPNPQGRLQVNHKSATNIPSIVVFDSTGGTGTGISFRKQASNREFVIASDGANMYYNPKEIGVDKIAAWSFLSTGQTGFGTNAPLGLVQVNNKSGPLKPALVLFDSTEGNGNMLAFRKQGQNKQFRMRTDLGGQDLELFSLDYTQGGVTDVDTWSTSGFAMRSNGNTGIGTTTPGGRLQLNNKSTNIQPTLLLMDSATGNGNAISFRRQGIDKAFRLRSNPSSQYQDGGLSFEVHNDGEIYSAALLTMRGDGKVGINNSSPDNALDVNGDMNFTGKLKVGGNMGVAGQVLTSSGAGGSPVWQYPISQGSGFNAYSDSFTVPAATVILAIPPNERFDNLNDYNVSTGEYIIPQTNDYALNAHVAICAYTSGNSGQTMHWTLEIVNPNNTLVSKLEKTMRVPPDSPGQCAQFTISSIQKLTTGQKVRLKVRHTFNGGVIRAIVDEFSAHRIL